MTMERDSFPKTAWPGTAVSHFGFFARLSLENTELFSTFLCLVQKKETSLNVGSVTWNSSLFMMSEAPWPYLLLFSL